MYNFKGISPQTIRLLCENRFQDSKPFYEAHKEEIKQGAVVPMRQIMLDLSGSLYELDDKMYTNPLYTVSRVRRDTRRSKSKMLYRENLWVMFRRNKFEYPNAPFMWFEFTPYAYSYGIGMWCERPAQMDIVRAHIKAHPRKFVQAADQLLQNGFAFETEFYKKDRDPSAPASVKPYINAKYLEFLHTDSDLSKINSPHLIDELKNFLNLASPMYRILITAYDDIVSGELL